ncbi:Cytochrome cd1-nitrite reductase-like C-terminal heme d1 [Penicillium paradoxum]|uniref:Cytochrome cd1-nitrite reductase-like C-terminal heme d1 n=1 Tax=Penicillium paradoxum TaxID=176176 RepID=UPI002547551A|nr:Cytochrome cd1-nitrite reductase-like C-terminal heme d1 [Penicillium paradoxum]KAJ5774116.1 Cytochrome cd1-nitrite reductase-like C-terminal heme d1 [Penicillium paradoxum]
MPNTPYGKMFWKTSNRSPPDKIPDQSLDVNPYNPSKSTDIVFTPNELGDPAQSPTDLGRKPSLVRSFRAGSTFGLPVRNLSVSHDRRNDPLGLNVVYEPETSPSLDIIFVHGLGGTSRATWARDRDPQYFWPEKWLPHEPGIRMARILSFGYNASWATTGVAPITGIADFAKDLLYSMKFAKSENLEELELGQMVVDKDSATLGYPEEISKALLADHHTVCKFESNQDSNYISVRNALKTLVSSIRSAGQSLFGEQGKGHLEQLQRLLAVSENYDEDLEFFRSRWTPGTCEWILAQPSFGGWMDKADDAPNVLWLHALPASGKSVLSSFVIQHLSEKSICVYYFFRFSDDSKRSLSMCLRSIAFQLAKQLPEFRRALKEMPFSTKTLEKTDSKTLWEKIFVRVLFKMQSARTIYWVIDALDESEHAQQLVELVQGISHSSTRIKVLFVSRQTSGLITTFDRLSTVLSVAYTPLESTKRDIGLYVEKEVEYMRAAPEFKARLVEKLVQGANGNFLWASLAMREVMECNTEEDFDETLTGIPAGMEQLYQRMERTIIANTKPRDRKLGQRILTWSACSRRPLALSELAQALEPDFALKVDLNLIINRVCGQFVIVDPVTGRLVMVHQTARDHLVTTDSELGVNISQGHERLLSECLAALEKRHHQPRDLNTQPGDRKASLRGEFFWYAMTSWAYHLDKLSPDSDAPLLLLARFLKGNYVLDWIVALAQTRRLHVLVSSAKSMNLYVRRKRGRYATKNPMFHRLQELDMVESWATDMLKLIGKFGLHLTESPTSIYHQIPPFCPKTSMIYRQFDQSAPRPHSLKVEGLSKSTWDDGLAKISLQPETQGRIIVCAGDNFAVLTRRGVITLYNSTTFETRHVLKHAEEVSAMRFSRNSHLLATYGYRSTKVWSVNSGQIIHRIKNPAGSPILSLTFCTDDTKIIIGSADRLLRIACLRDTNPAWVILHRNLLTMDTALDRPVHNVPRRMAFNSDASCVAVAYRGSPLCVWSLETETLLGRCMRSPEYAGNAWTVVDQVIWHPKSDEIIGLYMGGQVFRWNPYTNTQQELEAEGSILACSPEGKFFTVGDSQGTIKLYNFHHFTMVYKLSYNQVITDLCFSPDSKRLYDLRGAWCNVWEPNALLAGEENGDDSDLGSEAASVPTAMVSEASAEMKVQITAIAIQFGGRYHAVGNENGVVSVLDSSNSAHGMVELWRSSFELPTTHLDWSSDGRFLACVEMAGRVVVKGIQRDRDRTWTVQPVFATKINVHPEGIRQILLNENGSIILVKNGPSVSVQPVSSTPTAQESHTITSPNTKWSKHPTDAKLLFSVSPSHIRVYKWKDLSEVAAMDVGRTPLLLRPGSDLAADIDLDHKGSEKDAKVKRSYNTRSGSHFLIQTIFSTENRRETVISLFHTSSLFNGPTRPGRSSSNDMLMAIPAEIQCQIEIPLGILSRQRLVFLDKNYWMCSWSLSPKYIASEVERHYFLPKDWLSAEGLELCALLPDGVFLMPNNGEVAVVRSTELSRG